MKQQTKKQRRSSDRFSAVQKCQTVLSVWTDRRTVTEVCRELSINWTTFNAWQNQGLEAMLKALEPKVNDPSIMAPLSTKLENLLAKKAPQSQTTEPTLSPRLEKRLKALKKEPATG